jgi:hypothetical protein
MGVECKGGRGRGESALAGCANTELLKVERSALGRRAEHSFIGIGKHTSFSQKLKLT